MKSVSRLGALLVVCLSVSSLWAQVAGRLSGSVADPTGALIPAATVNVYIPGGSEPVLSTKTNDSGLFSFIAVRPDTYDVVVEAPGFGKASVRGIKISPLQSVTLPPIKLEVASSTATVEVTADTEAVQVSNGEVASTITATQVQNLPVLGRQVSSLLLTQAGVSSGSGTTTVNGLRSSYVNMTLDGVNIQDNFIRTNDLDYAPMRTTIDQVAEITVQSSNASAAIGGGAAAVVMSTKSGSNEFHGSGYWYNRNNALAANDWFNNMDGVDKPNLNLNQVGAALGGPIKKDKLFFYGNYEVYRNKRQSNVLRTVLTDSAKNGIFKYRDASGNIQSVDLQSMRNFQVNPDIQAMIDQLPSPNSSSRGDGLNTGGYLFNARGNEFRDQFVYKGDYYLSSNHAISGTYNYISNPTDRPDAGSFYGSMPLVSNTIKDHLLSISWRWTASPTLTNELRGGFMRAATAFVDSNEYPSYIASGLLFSSPVNTFLNQGRDVNTYNIQDNANWIKGKHEISFGFQSQMQRTRPYNDAGTLPTYTLGISTANTTGLTRDELPGIGSTDLTTANNLYANLAGIISQATQTFNVTSTTSGFVPGAGNVRNFTNDTYAGYVQDKWRVRKNLTVDLGLRYEYWKPLDETHSLYLAPILENNNLQATLLDPNAVLDFIGNSVGRPFYKTDKNNFAPNVAIAWDPFGDGKTSIRGGFMLSYVNDNVLSAVRNNVGTSAGLQSPNTMTNLVANLANRPVVGVPEYKVPRTLADNYAVNPTSATGMPDPNMVTPYVPQWNLSIEHEFHNTVFAVRYIGNRGKDLLRAFDYNQVLYNADGFMADFQRAQSNAALSEAAGLKYIGSYNPNIAGSQPLTVFPLLTGGGLLTNATVQNYLRQGQVGSLADLYQSNRLNGSVNFYTNPNVQGANTIANTAWSTYNALQVEVTRRMASGLQMQFSYTFSKNMSNSAGDGQTNFEPLLDNNNPSLEVARTPYDLTHVFKANYHYELPFGLGKRWSGGAIMNRILGGWSLDGIWGYQSGSPYSILSGRGTLNRGARSGSSNTASVFGTTNPEMQPLTSGVFMTGDGPYFISPTLISPAGRGAEDTPFAGQIFYNPTAGNVGNLQRRMFSGPWEWSWDASVVKNIPITERQRLEMHFDFFNFANHPTFFVSPSQGDYGSTTNQNINNTSFGKLTSMQYNPRVIQIGAYYKF